MKTWYKLPLLTLKLEAYECVLCIKIATGVGGIFAIAEIFIKHKADFPNTYYQ